LAFSPDNRFLAAGEAYGSGIELWDTGSGKKVHTIPMEDGYARGLAFVGNDLLASSGGNTTIVLWDVSQVRRKL
jgi:WD40 repeat protein